jgi:hypothetical protein
MIFIDYTTNQKTYKLSNYYWSNGSSKQSNIEIRLFCYYK